MLRTTTRLTAIKRMPCAHHHTRRAFATVSKPSLDTRRHEPLSHTELHQALRAAAATAASRGADAFYHVDLPAVLSRVERWREALPRVDPYYAVKCNPDAELLATLAAAGVGFDCASQAEMAAVTALGVHPTRIVYANPCKPPAHLAYAAHAGIRLHAFDSECELEKTAQLAPRAQLLLRIAVDDAKAQCALSNKYGAAMHEVPALLATAEHLGLHVRGVSFHVGSGCYDPAAYADAVARADEVFAHARAPMDVLDVGGGFPGVDTPALAFGDIAAVLRSALDARFPAERAVRIIAEPGRYFAASASTLATSVIGTKHVDKSGGAVGGGAGAAEPHNKYYLSDGMYGSFNCLLYDHASVTPEVLSHAASAEADAEPCSLWGPTCDGFDCIVEETRLPRLRVGDWLYFRNMGAYTAAAGSSFNGMPLPSPIYRRVETSAARPVQAAEVDLADENHVSAVRIARMGASEKP